MTIGTMPTRAEVLSAGVRWLFETEQPDEAVIQHHGESRGADNNRTYRFIPSGAAGHAVVVVDVTRWEWVARGTQSEPDPVLELTELDDLTAELAGLGIEVVDTWNGHPAITGSLALARPAHPTLLAAVSRYHAGCLEHPAKSVFCDCGWYRRGYARIERLGVVAAEVTV